MSGIPLSETMKPYPLDTSNHLMTPLNSMTLAASPAISPPVARSLDKPLAGPFGPIPSEIMTPHRRRSVQALLACASNPGPPEDTILRRTDNSKIHLPATGDGM